MCVVCLAAYQDACPGEVGCRTVAEPECHACPCLHRAERHLCGLARGHVGQCVAEGLCEALHHSAVDFAFGECGHTLGHYDVMAACAAHMIVCDASFHRLAQPGEVGIKLCNVVFEQRLLHGDKGIPALDDVARVAQRVVCVVDMQLETAEVMHLETSFFLCHNCDC